MLSFRNGRAFCAIRGGPNHNKQIRIHDETNEKDHKYEYDPRKLKQFDKEELKLLKDALDRDNDEYLNGKLKRVFDKIKYKGDIGKDFYDENAIVKLIPTDDPDQRDSIYICGPSGSGKSTFVSSFIEEYIIKYPKRQIVLFSAKPSDPALDKYQPIRIPLNDDLVTDPIKLEELEHSLVIFDDIDQISDKHIQKAVWNLRDRILEVGRSLGISICTVSHLITNYKASRICLNEADYVILFCKSGGRKQIDYFLDTYIGLDKQQKKKLMDLKSRAVILKKTYPLAVIYQNGCYAL